MSGSSGEAPNRAAGHRRSGWIAPVGLISAAVVAVLAFFGSRARDRRPEPASRPVRSSQTPRTPRSPRATPERGAERQAPVRPRRGAPPHRPERAIGMGPVGPVTTRIEIPVSTIVRVVAAIALVWALIHLRTQVVVVFVALVLALALDPLVTRLVRRGWSRGRSVLAVMLGAVLLFAGLMALVVPPLVSQADRLVENWDEYVDDVRQIIEENPRVDSLVQDVTSPQAGSEQPSIIDRVADFLPNVLSVGAGVVSGVVAMFVLLVMTIYLLLDGPRLFELYTSRLDPAGRARMRRLRIELTKVVSGYVLGQAAVSSLFGIFTFVTLSIAGAPEPLLMAVVAAVLGAIPMVGATLATIPAVLLSLTVSVPTGLVVLALFIGYQQFENNVIAPRAFRNTLKVSPLVVLIAVSFGSALYGVLGAMLSLPLAAAVPALIRGLKDGVPLPKASDPGHAWPAEPERRPTRTR